MGPSPRPPPRGDGSTHTTAYSYDNLNRRTRANITNTVGGATVVDTHNYYDPSLARFTQTDPANQLSLHQSNLYSYAGDGPTYNSDPSGQWYRNYGYISCTIYFNRRETRDIAYGLGGAAAVSGTLPHPSTWYLPHHWASFPRKPRSRRITEPLEDQNTVFGRPLPRQPPSLKGSSCLVSSVH